MSPNVCVPWALSHDLLILSLFIACMCGWIRIRYGRGVAIRGQLTESFPHVGILFNMWVSGIELGSLGLASSLPVEPTWEPRLALSSWQSSCLGLPNVEMTVVYCYTSFSDTFLLPLTPHTTPYAPIVAAGFVFRQCGSDGQWESWRDHTQCENPEKNGAFQVRGGEGFRLGCLGRVSKTTTKRPREFQAHPDTPCTE